MKRDNKIVGKLGEEAVLERLLVMNYELVEKNYSTKFGEIDLICRDGETMVFVEVKTKKGKLYGSPEEMFGRGKYNKVKRMGQVYLNGREVKCRVDMAAVELDSENRVERLTIYTNVYF